MKKVLVTGAHGYLASLARLYNSDRIEFSCVSHTDVDFSRPDEVEKFFGAADFDVCLHMAADATTAHCEEQPELTHRVNTESAIAIAKVCRERAKRMVFISTEQCFNAVPGKAPFFEDDEQASLSDYLILRFSWMFGLSMPGVKASPNILGNVLAAVKGNKPTAFRVHELRNMTYAQRFAEQLPQILELPSGAYHFASQNGLSTYETARLVASRLGCSEAEVDRLILPDQKTYSERPRDFRLASDKIQAAGIELGTFEEDLDRCLADFGW